MKTYLGTKLVQAEPMNRGDYNKYRGWEIPADENPTDEGYLVRYEDRYESWSPKNVFEEAYKEADGFTFGMAIEALKLGMKVARHGWNGNKKPPIIDSFPDYEFSGRMEFAKELDLVYIRLSNGDVAVCDGCDYDKLKQQEKWSISSGYPYYTDYSNGKKTVQLHTLILGELPDGYMVDHINGNTLDNRRMNLRIVSSQQNNANRKSKGGTSAYKGVSWDSSRKKWISSIQTEGKTKHIGRFKNEVDAAKAYDKQAYLIYGQYAKLNFPKEPLPARTFLFLKTSSIVPKEELYAEEYKKAMADVDVDDIVLNSHIDMKLADNTVLIGWTPNQLDMLAEDWCIVE